MKRMNFPHRKEARREAAFKRQAMCNKLSPKERLAKLDKLGMTAKKERAKLCVVDSSSTPAR